MFDGTRFIENIYSNKVLFYTSFVIPVTPQEKNPEIFNREGLLISFLGVLLVLQDVFMLRMVGWLLVSGIILKTPEKGMVFCFFFAPFFWYSAGSFKLLFTLKPFQIAFFMTLAAYLFFSRKAFWQGIAIVFKQPGNWFLSGFLLSLYLAIFFNHADHKSLRLTINLTLLIAWFFLATGMIRTREQSLACLHSYFTGSALIVAGITLKGILDHGASIFEGHNAYGNFLLFCLPLTVALFISAKNKWSKVFFWAFFFVLAWNLCMSFSRAAIMAFSLSFFVMAVFFICKGYGKRILLFMIFCLLAFLLAWQSAGKFGSRFETFKDRFTSGIEMAGEVLGLKKKAQVRVDEGYQSINQNRPVQVTEMVQGKIGAALKIRSKMWGETALNVKKNPFLGKGLYLDGHSMYFDLLYSSGILGAGCFFLFLLLWCYNTLRRVIRGRFTSQDYSTVGVLASVAAWLIQASVESYFLLFYIWAFLALGAVSKNLED